MTNTYISTHKDSNQLSLTIYNNGFGTELEEATVQLYKQIALHR